jgi:glycogenin glucosyltransferase
VSIDFDHVDDNLKWKDLFPTWIDEDEKYGHPKCIDLPMPIWECYRDINVVIAKVPCGKGIKDVFMLQVNLGFVWINLFLSLCKQFIQFLCIIISLLR